MVERLGARARQVLVLAEEEARMFNHNTIGTEHILLGLVQAGGIAGDLLTDLDIDLEAVHSEVEKVVGRGQVFSAGSMNLSSRAAALLGRSSEEAARLGQDEIDGEHILLGMLSDEEDPGTLALKGLGVETDLLRGRILAALDRSARPGGRPDRPVRPVDVLLGRFGRDLTDAARAGEFDPVLGRESELDRLVQVLLRRTKNSPLLLGGPGVGKTALVEALACRIAEGQVPDGLREVRLYALDLGSLLAGASRRGVFEERLKTVLTEARDDGEIVLFLDEVHALVGAGDSSGGLDASALVKPLLERGELRLIGATTPEEYRSRIAGDAALGRRFQVVAIEPPTVAGTIEMLEGLRPRYESHHGVTITDAALVAATRLTDRHVRGRLLPDKAVDAVDEACALARIRGTAREVTEDLVREVVAATAGVPLERLGEDDLRRLRDLETELRRRVVGQDAAIASVSAAIRRSRAGVADPDRPIGSFLFAGPSGVGKSLLAKALAEVLSGSEDALVQIDMGEYAESHAVSSLVGAPPGYEGFEAGGLLTRAVERSSGVVLFDEIEKAHPAVLDILLQILEEGRIGSGDGRTTSFTGSVVIMTTNLGTAEAGAPRGFASERHEDRRAAITGELRRSLRPELLNRVDEVVVFSALGAAELLAVLDLEVNALADRFLRGAGAILDVTPQARRCLLASCHDPGLGARPLRRVVQRELDDLLSSVLIQNAVRAGQRVSVTSEDGVTLKLTIT
ncbi:AAA family ATPase [Nonomuraea sp. AD125B]|uniref:AAA family ATPase n=1 Tax=Nonomuraea sp. AD125B TaxID=3242897 RepID=UPI00352976FA